MRHNKYAEHAPSVSRPSILQPCMCSQPPVGNVYTLAGRVFGAASRLDGVGPTRASCAALPLLPQHVRAVLSEHAFPGVHARPVPRGTIVRAQMLHACLLQEWRMHVHEERACIQANSAWLQPTFMLFMKSWQSCLTAAASQAFNLASSPVTRDAISTLASTSCSNMYRQCVLGPTLAE